MPKTRDGYGSDPRPPSKKVLKAAGLILAGEAKTITEAAELVGIARETLSRNLKRPDVTDAIRQMVSNRMKTVGVLKAANTLETLIEGSGSDYVKLDAAKYALGSAGVKPTTDHSHGGRGLIVQINLPASVAGVGTHSAGSGVIDHDPHTPAPIEDKSHE